MRFIEGFTVIEMVVALAMAGVLAAVAIPNYVEYSKRGKRSDAVTALTQVQLAQERWRANNTSYTSDLQALGVADTSPAGNYTLSVTGASASGYTAIATATSSLMAADSRCAALQLVLAGGNLSYTSSDSSHAVDSVGTNRCWGR